jgi:hypothetical protein
MKITLLLTPRLVVIISACASAVVLLLVMLGFELGLRQAHEDRAAYAKGHGENMYGAATVAPSSTTRNTGRNATSNAPIDAANAAGRNDADTTAAGASRGAP